MADLPSIGNRGSEDKAQVYTIAAARAIAAAYPQIRSIGMWRPPDGYNEHSSGMAADVMIPDWNTPQGRTLGDQVCAYALTLQGVDYVIWRQALHYPGGRVQGMSDRGSPTQNHMDHNHVHTTGGGYPKPGQTYPAPGAPAQEDGAVVLSKVMGGTVSLDRYRELLPGFRAAVVMAKADQPKRINMFAAQLGHESVGLKYMEEIWGPTTQQLTYQGRMGNNNPGDGERYKGRGPIQVTGKDNYRALSVWAHSNGFVPSPTFFVDQPTQLASPNYGFLGAVWYWTVARPKINEYCDWDDLEASLVAVTKAINGGTTGIDDRRKRLNLARSMDLAPIMRDTQPSTGDDMAAVPQDQWDRVYRELTQRLPSRSPLRHLGEGLVDTVAGFVLNADGSTHVEVVKMLAELGQPAALALLREVAAADPIKYPDRQEDAKLAQAILAEATAPTAAVRSAVATSSYTGDELASAVAENARLRDEISRLNIENIRLQTAAQAPVETAVIPYEPPTPEPKTMGERVGNLVNSMEDYTELALTMNVKQRAAMAKSIEAFQMDTNGNGAQV